VVALSHLDTQWRWTARDTARAYLPDTVRSNRALFARFPSYVLSFEGAWRYRLLAEHHPALFDQVREDVRGGRWHPAGAAVEAFDCLLPSPESILHQIVLGRRYFRQRLERDSRDLFLPDCFGFPGTLPTLAVHAGLVGFSTQKLRRGPLMRSANGIPFSFGRWRGPDGSELLAALDPGEYSGRIDGDLTRDPEWIARFEALAATGEGDRLLFYVGTGDRGGAPPAPTVARLEEALHREGSIEVLHGPSEGIFLATGDDERAALPHYAGELLLRLHGTGCYSAKSILKRWNDIGERLARRAEIAAAAARTVGGGIAPARFVAAWTPLLAHQMHDDLTGTAIPPAYRLTLDDLGLAAARFEEILLDAMAQLGAELEADGAQAEVLALATHARPARWLAELELAPGETPPLAVRGAEDAILPVQVGVGDAGEPLALVPLETVGVEIQALELLDVRPSETRAPEAEPLEARLDRLENGRYLARFDDRGRLASLLDKRLGLDLLTAPVELELLPDSSPKYPAWEIRWSDASAPPVARFEDVVDRRIVESGPLRAALRIERRQGASRVVETWRLASFGETDWLRCDVALDWRSRGRLLKQRFDFAAAAPEAVYDTGLGAVRRPLASEDLYEVPAQHWAAIESRQHAVAVLSDSRHGWDHPESGTLRLTWIHSPRPGHKFRHQGTQDRGRHRFSLAVAGLSAGAVGQGEAARLADRFLQVPDLYRRALAADRPRATGRRRFLALAAPTRLLTWKPEDVGDSTLLRLSNPTDAPSEVEVVLAPELGLGVTVDAMEEPLPGPPATRLPPSGLAARRVLGSRTPRTGQGSTRPVPLPWNLRGFSRQGEGLRPGFDGRGRSLPLERPNDDLLGTSLPFDLAHLGASTGDVYQPDGNPVELPRSTSELWLLAASVDGERRLKLDIGGQWREAEIPDWRRPLLRESRWRRSWAGRWHLDEGHYRRLPVAFSTLHLHDADGRDLVLERGTLFAIALRVAGASTVVFEPDRSIRIVAAITADESLRPWRSAAPPPLP